MIRMQKDEILERLLFSDGVAEAYARPEKESTEKGCDHWNRLSPKIGNLGHPAGRRQLERSGKATAASSLTTPKLKKTFGAPFTQNDSLVLLGIPGKRLDGGQKTEEPVQVDGLSCLQ